MEMSPQALIEALLFAEGGPMSTARLQTLLEVSPEMLSGAIALLSQELEGRGISLIQTVDSIELRTTAAAAPFVERLRKEERARDLGKAPLEVLAIILYQGSATRNEIDWFRGVNSTTAIRALIHRGLVTIAEDREDRRRARYTASVDALAFLGVTSAQDLPEYTEISRMLLDRQETAVAMEGGNKEF